MMTENSCVHHWVVDTLAADGFYHSRCKKCGAKKDFPCVELRGKNIVISRNPDQPLVIKPPKKPRGRPRKALPRLEE